MVEREVAVAASLVSRSNARTSGAEVGAVGLNSVVAKRFDRATASQGSATAVVVNVVVVNLNDPTSRSAYTVRAVVGDRRIGDSGFV